jgi:serine/threonine-protein kinase
VVLLDFGIAKLAPEDGGAATRTGIIMGTPDYMAPEQCMAAKLADHRADLYALGCILFHMIAGRVPFEGGGPGAIMAAHLGSPPPPLGKFARVPADRRAGDPADAKEPEGSVGGRGHRGSERGSAGRPGRSRAGPGRCAARRTGACAADAETFANFDSAVRTGHAAPAPGRPGRRRTLAWRPPAIGARASLRHRARADRRRPDDDDTGYIAYG